MSSCRRAVYDVIMPRGAFEPEKKKNLPTFNGRYVENKTAKDVEAVHRKFEQKLSSTEAMRNALEVPGSMFSLAKNLKVSKKQKVGTFDTLVPCAATTSHPGMKKGALVIFMGVERITIPRAGIEYRVSRYLFMLCGGGDTRRYAITDTSCLELL